MEIDKIPKWIKDRIKEPMGHCTTAFGRTFGVVKMSNGRKAQVKVTLEMDEDDWD